MAPKSPYSFWMPPQGAVGSALVDRMFGAILWIAIFFFVLIVALMITFVVRYRARRAGGPQTSPDHSMPLELAWSAIPFVILMIIFYAGFHGFMELTTPPENSYEIQVTGQKWSWMFTYPNGYVDQNLHVPADTPVLLVMTSEDVIHSMFIPAFRIKQDVVPGRYTRMWFQAPRPGKFDIFCAEYCGTGHSAMHATVYVRKPGAFARWLEDADNFIDRMPPADAGAQVFKKQGCAQCHSVDGKAGIGPSLKGVFGKKQPLRGGGAAVADEDYLRESIMESQAKVVAGFDPVMPTYKGRLKDKEITVLIAYIKSLEK